MPRCSYWKEKDVWMTEERERGGKRGKMNGTKERKDQKKQKHTCASEWGTPIAWGTLTSRTHGGPWRGATDRHQLTLCFPR